MITKSLMFQLSVIIVLIASGTLGAFGYYRFQVESSNSKDHIQEELTTTTERLTMSLHMALYEFHDEGVRFVILSEMKNPDIVGIYIVEPWVGEQKYWYSKDANGNPIVVSEFPDKDHYINSSSPIVHDSEEIGEVFVYMSTQRMDAQLHEKLMSIVLQIVILDVLLIVFVIFLLRIKVIHPILNVKSVALQIRNGNLNQHIKSKGHNEIAQLGQTFNIMTDNLKGSRREIEKYSKNLEYQVVERTKQLDEKVIKLQKSEAAAHKTMEDLNDALAERKKMVAELRIKDHAMASSINAIAIADLEGNLTYVNNSFLDLWGYHDDNEVLGKRTAEFWKMEDKAAKVPQSIQDTGSWLGELAVKRKDGSVFDASLSANTVADDTGKPICMMASFIDISERKKAEKQLHGTIKDLERFNRVAVGREHRMIELKWEVNSLLHSIGRQEKYEPPPVRKR